jgi:hypothetical protein
MGNKEIRIGPSFAYSINKLKDTWGDVACVAPEFFISVLWLITHIVILLMYPVSYLFGKYVLFVICERRNKEKHNGKRNEV